MDFILITVISIFVLKRFAIVVNNVKKNVPYENRLTKEQAMCIAIAIVFISDNTLKIMILFLYTLFSLLLLLFVYLYDFKVRKHKNLSALKELKQMCIAFLILIALFLYFENNGKGYL